MAANGKSQQDLQHALALHKQGDLAGAAAAYQAVLKKDPRNFDANHYFGMVLVQQGKADLAVPRLQAAVKINAQSALAHLNLGVACAQSGRRDEAVASFDRALALKPDYPDALRRKAAVLQDGGDAMAALQALQALSAVAPQDAGVALAEGHALRRLGRYAGAVDAYARACDLQPQNLEAWLSRALVLRHLKNHRAALDVYGAAMALYPDHPALLAGMAELLDQLKNFEAAVQGFTRVLETDPANTGVLHSRGMTYSRMNRPREALADLSRVFAAAPETPLLESTLHHLRLQMCDWSAWGDVPDFIMRLRAGSALANPLTLVALPAGAEDQLQASRHYGEKHMPARAALWRGEKYDHDKIRIAYLSSDFHRHATAFLAAGLFECHDRDAFEIIGLSCGGNDNSAMRDRLAAAFDDFIDVSQASDEDIAQMVRSREIDILVDLKGYTQDNRLGVLAHRPAPVQVTYLGFPGPLGMPYIDYAIVDRVVANADVAPHFDEKLVFMPHSYQVNDDRRGLGPAPSRAAAGLPEGAFVFCSFNHTYKITPETFDVWMRVLSRVPDSVLWLLDANDVAAGNLRREAAARGVDPTRLVFAPRMPAEDHLARQALAGLFLDNLPCNAHTTASDALWAGLPVLTCAGRTFAGRVAASLLQALDLPELVTGDWHSYEDAAVRLAQNPAELSALRAKLADNRAVKPLFDTGQWTLQIENAYRHMHARQQAGEAPESFDVPAA